MPIFMYLTVAQCTIMIQSGIEHKNPQSTLTSQWHTEGNKRVTAKNKKKNERENEGGGNQRRERESSSNFGGNPLLSLLHKTCDKTSNSFNSSHFSLSSNIQLSKDKQKKNSKCPLCHNPAYSFIESNTSLNTGGQIIQPSKTQTQSCRVDYNFLPLNESSHFWLVRLQNHLNSVKSIVILPKPPIQLQTTQQQVFKRSSSVYIVCNCQ